MVALLLLLQLLRQGGDLRTHRHRLLLLVVVIALLLLLLLLLLLRLLPLLLLLRHRRHAIAGMPLRVTLRFPLAAVSRTPQVVTAVPRVFPIYLLNDRQSMGCHRGRGVAAGRARLLLLVRRGCAGRDWGA
ncbi:hypothetical protein JKP88DRAFT_287170 [Tribonema minus]|uniref:Uncharacterized protein n=1 Tax=Tribonema minus TaxID=303371 RepID=A0A835ZED4_9STRA|nr:hypothetical protein JKP88DRAFT_287170 [Tribonema minus]